MKSQFRLTLLSVVAVLCIGMTQPAFASWSWNSALLWSQSVTDCTSPGEAQNDHNFKFANTSAAVNCTNAVATASAQTGWGGGTGRGKVTPGKTGGFGPLVHGDAEAGISTPDFTISMNGIHFNGVGTASETGQVPRNSPPSYIREIPIRASAESSTRSTSRILSTWVYYPGRCTVRSSRF